MAEPNNYITATRKNFVSNDNEGRMVKKCIVEIQGTFLVKIRDDAFNGNVGENAFKHIDKLVSDEGLRGLQAWVAQGPERQQAATAGAHKDGLATKEVAQEIPAPAQAPVQAPPPPPPAPKSRTIFTTEQYRVSTWLISCMTQIMDVNDYTYQPFDSTLVGSSQLSFQRRVRPRTGDASTSAAPHTDAQHDP
ncbi:hypothetical protein Tco_1294229 [Tanacetum coccineum]